ncbi:Tyrosine-protein phosphatase non-receptor type 1 [Merluccius polli]|uniref:protein-tyrosine-phosphatase n=1 Tax=Merluccius polli TaxID=89951 RepID=A0AA47PBR1_MERPO|nr:Tyrosine-protein phosphatase non-receptor type 1 [Merluccius polli]
MSVRKDPSSVRIRDVLLEMRRCRMGLIQTADQLRFSYLAVIEGAKCIMGDAAPQASLSLLGESWNELSNEDEDYPEFTPPPPPPPPPPRPDKDSHHDTILPPSSAEYNEIITQSVCSLGSQPDSELRRRNVGDPQPPTETAAPPEGGVVETQEEHVSRDAAPPRPEHPAENPETPVAAAAAAVGADPDPGAKSPGSWSPVVVNVCLCTAFALSAYVCYRACYH